MSSTPLFPITPETAQDAYEFIFAPWLKQMGLCDFSVSEGRASARLPEKSELKFVGGGICGQALMAAIDTVAVMAISTGDRMTKGTTYQHTHFVRPANGGDLIIAADVLRFGKSSAYVEARVSFAVSGDLVAHAVLEFAF